MYTLGMGQEYSHFSYELHLQGLLTGLLEDVLSGTHPSQLCLVVQQLLSHSGLVTGGLGQLVVGMLQTALMALHLQLQLSQLRPAGLHLAVALGQASTQSCNLAVPLSALQDSTVVGLQGAFPSADMHTVFLCVHALCKPSPTRTKLENTQSVSHCLPAVGHVLCRQEQWSCCSCVRSDVT